MGFSSVESVFFSDSKLFRLLYNESDIKVILGTREGVHYSSVTVT